MMAYDAKEAEVAFRTGCEHARNRILDLLCEEIALRRTESRDGSQSPTYRTMHRCFCEMYEEFEKKISDLNIE